MKKSLFTLACGTLALGIAEFVLMGILPNVASDLNISIIQAGHLISAYAIGVCVGAPLTVFVARTRPLKQILYGLCLLIAIGNLFTGLAPSYWVMLIFRFLSGLPHGSFFGVGSIVAERISKEGKTAQAVSLMVSGMTIANLLGVPMGTFISNTLSWRITFFLVSGLGVILLYLVWKWIPKMEALPDTGLKGQFRFLKRLSPWLIIGATALGNGGIFAWYSYVNPVLTKVSGFTAGNMSIIMFLAGLGMVIGNLVGGKLSDRFTSGRVASVTQLTACLALMSIFLFAHIGWLSLILLITCTTCLFALSAPEQLLILENSRGSELLGAACVQVAFNLGNAIGAYSGGLPIAAGKGYEYTALVGTPFAFAGFLLLLYYTFRYEKRSSIA